MLPPSREDAWLCLHLYEQRREPLLREARDWLFTFTPSSFADIKALIEGRTGEEDNRRWRQVTSYWEMISAIMMSGAIAAEGRELFVKTTKEFFLCYAKLQPYLADIRAATRPAAFQNLESFCRSLPDHDALLAYFTKMNEGVRDRKARASARAGKKR